MNNLQSRIERLEQKRGNLSDPFDPYRWHPGGDFYEYQCWLDSLNKDLAKYPIGSRWPKGKRDPKKPLGWDKYCAAQPRIELPSLDELRRIAQERRVQIDAANRESDAQQSKPRDSEAEARESAPSALPTDRGGYSATTPIELGDHLDSYRDQSPPETALVGLLNDMLERGKS
jgi:hypothetical protein